MTHDGAFIFYPLSFNLLTSTATLAPTSIIVKIVTTRPYDCGNLLKQLFSTSIFNADFESFFRFD